VPVRSARRPVAREGGRPAAREGKIRARRSRPARQRPGAAAGSRGRHSPSATRSCVTDCSSKGARPFARGRSESGRSLSPLILGSARERRPLSRSIPWPRLSGSPSGRRKERDLPAEAARLGRSASCALRARRVWLVVHKMRTLTRVLNTKRRRKVVAARAVLTVNFFPKKRKRGDGRGGEPQQPRRPLPLPGHILLRRPQGLRGVFRFLGPRGAAAIIPPPRIRGQAPSKRASRRGMMIPGRRRRRGRGAPAVPAAAAAAGARRTLAGALLLLAALALAAAPASADDAEPATAAPSPPGAAAAAAPSRAPASAASARPSSSPSSPAPPGGANATATAVAAVAQGAAAALQPRVTVARGLPSSHGIQSISVPGTRLFFPSSPAPFLAAVLLLCKGGGRATCDGIRLLHSSSLWSPGDPRPATRRPRAFAVAAGADASSLRSLFPWPVFLLDG
jgi:hypothetical protein